MGKSVVPIHNGFATQARWFWWIAMDLYLETYVAKVGYEVEEPTGFDDVAVYYKTALPCGSRKDFYQIKFRTVAGRPFTCESLIDPEFINASSVSLLQRLRTSQKEHAPTGTEARFFIAIPTPIDPNDPLAKLVEKTNGSIRWGVLKEGGPRSTMGKVRALWKAHLGIERDEELRLVLAPLRIRAESYMMDDLRKRASERLRLAGWKPYDDLAISSKYDHLPQALVQGGRTIFDREELTQIGVREGLWEGPPLVMRPEPLCVGIRSFGRGTERMSEEQDEMLCLLDFFDGRWPNDDDGWDRAILPEVRRFLSGLAAVGPVHLELSTHGTVAFAAGYALDSKAGVEVYPVQVSGARDVWRPLAIPPVGQASWDSSMTELGDGVDLALAIGVTHDILAEVVEFVTDYVPEVGHVMGLQPRSGPSSSVVRNGTHALQLVQSATAVVRRALAAEAGRDDARLHIFAAAPAGLLFILGQHARVLGPCCLYEHDFGRARRLAYERSGTFPPPDEG